MALTPCILGKFLGIGCHCFPLPLDVPTFATRCLHVLNDVRNPSSERWHCGQEIIFCSYFAEMTISTPFRDLLHAANLWHGTDGFTPPPKKGALRIFSPLKIQQLWPGLNPRTWVLKASTLPLDHRSHLVQIIPDIKTNTHPNFAVSGSNSSSSRIGDFGTFVLNCSGTEWNKSSKCCTYQQYSNYWSN
jgi:hypothetical protein